MGILVRLCFSAALVGLLTTTTRAELINGALSFTGGYTVDNPNLSVATKFTGFNNVTVLVGSDYGAYAGTGGSAVTFTPFTFNPAQSGVTPLWTFTISSTTYSFDATSIKVDFAAENVLALSGEGVAKIDGMDDTVGDWTITANKLDSSFSFSSSAVAVPEPGTILAGVLLLLPFGATTIRVLRRKI